MKIYTAVSVYMERIVNGFFYSISTTYTLFNESYHASVLCTDAWTAWINRAIVKNHLFILFIFFLMTNHL